MPGYHYYRAADALAFGHSYTRFQSAPATYTYESDTYVQAAIFSEYFLQAQLPHVHPAELEAEFFCLQERINQGATDVDIDHYLRLGLVLGLTIQSGSDAPSPLGDLTAQEVKRIQDVVDQVGRPIEVVGSAAKGSVVVLELASRSGKDQARGVISIILHRQQVILTFADMRVNYQRLTQKLVLFLASTTLIWGLQSVLNLIHLLNLSRRRINNATKILVSI
jgi:hypothetical protein